ncbi:MAG TPA: hypothetical protein VFD32_16690, partial [Dehalococcoidia bacterium]|nr:hypothetical protein [Dehalococcoidia bacterium]
LLALLAATTGAVRLQAVTVAAPAPAIPDSLLRFATPDSGPDIAAAVARDLFAEDRTPPPRRYRLPGDADATPRPPAPRPVVLGTALGTGEADFAICQIAGGAPVIVRAGSRIGEFTVLSIERTRVWFRGPDGERISIDASKPVP